MSAWVHDDDDDDNGQSQEEEDNQSLMEVHGLNKDPYQAHSV